MRIGAARRASGPLARPFPGDPRATGAYRQGSRRLLDIKQFSLPITGYVTSYFLTARLAARRMVPNKSGVIMTVSALPARTGAKLNGGYGAANAAKEALTRDLSAELAPRGIRVVALRPHGMPETSAMREVYDLKAKAVGMSWEQFQGYVASTTHPRRVMTLGVGKCGGFHGFRQGERDDGNYRQFEHGESGRLAPRHCCSA
jgi:NAD(P)-dependent dehydrogenase (short-subunit alcohol dehydrogenase family)